MAGIHYLLALTLLAVALCNAQRTRGPGEGRTRPPRPEREDGNEYVDGLLSKVQAKALSDNNTILDPFQYRNVNTRIVKVSGVLYGLSKIHRKGNATILVNRGLNRTRVVGVEAVLAVENITSDYRLRAEFFHLPLTVNATSTISEVVVSLRLRNNFRTRKLDVVDIDVARIGKIKTTIETPVVIPGHDWVVSRMVEGAANALKGIAAKTLRLQFRIIVQQVLDKLDLPVVEE